MDDKDFKESQEIILDRYKKMEVRTVIFSAVLDEKVCEACRSKNRKIYTTNQARGVIPVHKNCRCMWVPLMQGQLFGENVEQAVDAVKAVDLPNQSRDPTESVFFV